MFVWLVISDAIYYLFISNNIWTALLLKQILKCMIKIFRGGKRWWMGRGVAVKDA